MNGMVSRRKFISMTLMMIVLLFMFQFTQVIKDMDNQYNVNEYAIENPLNEMSVWKMTEQQEGTILTELNEKFVVYLGSSEDAVRPVVYQWCTYTKRDFVEGIAPEKISKYASNIEVVLINSQEFDFEKNTGILTNLAKNGVSMIFCNLPEPEIIISSSELQKLLGIRNIESLEVELKGIKLFPGFLLGGETVYEVKEPEDEKRQDLDLTVPYYVAFGGTKTYMVGVIDKKSTDNEYLPALIWRNSYEDAKIFAVNGDYMSNSTGLGILNAMMTELHPYELYPVINAQNLTVANFPGFANENAEEMQRIYSRTPANLYRDIVWPSIAATTGKNQLDETLFFMAQNDYSDGIEPTDADYVFYLKDMKEQGTEAGISLDNHSNISLTDKVKKDGAFYEQSNDGYLFTAGYIGSKEERQALLDNNLLNVSALNNLQTIVQKYDVNTDIVSYLNQDVTLLSTTSDGLDYTFSQDLRMRSLQTALGYSNILLDLYVLTWPEDTNDTWEKMYDDFSRNVNTFWNAFKMFDKTTVSETDRRVRNLFALDYSHACENNVISLHVDNFQTEAWFILKTNNSEIEEVTGAEYKLIEDDAYLLRITNPNVQIYLSEEIKPYYYIP